MKVYQTSKGIAIVIYIAAPLLIAVFCYTLVMPFISEQMSTDLAYFFVPLSLAMIGLIVVAVLETKKGKIIIRNDSLSSIGALANRELKFKDIKGFKDSENYIFVLPKSNLQKRIRISKYLGDFSELMLWLDTNFSNIDVEDSIREENDIYRNQAYGITTNERVNRLALAKKVTKGITWLSIGAILATIGLKNYDYSDYLLIIFIVLPIISIATLFFFKGIVKIHDKDSSAYPSVLWGILISTGLLFLKAMFGFNILDYSTIWMPVSLITAGLIIAILLSRTIDVNQSKELLNLLILAVFLFAYSYGAVVITNGIFDKSTATFYETRIINKHQGGSKYKTYNLKLAPWGTQIEAEEVTVSKLFYETMEVGHTVTVYLKKGKFNIPWYGVIEEEIHK